MEFEGYGINVKTDDEGVLVEATNFVSKGALGGVKSRKIPYAAVTGLDFTEPTFAKNGNITIGTAQGKTILHFLKKHADGARALHTELVANTGDAASRAVTGGFQSAVGTGSTPEASARDREIWLAGHPIWNATVIVGQLPSDKATAAVEQHAGGESPWFAIGSGSGGILTAWDDHLMIVKTGGATAFMAGATGGGRIATFSFHDITGIEYNSGWATGVLEILTASYQGSANHDFWTGSLSGRNSNAGDPYTLSNTLPLPKSVYDQAADQMVALRRRIADVRRPNVVMSSQTQSVPEQLAKLNELRVAGVISADEFSDAKARLLASL